MRKILVLKPLLLTRANGGDISLIERLQLFQSWGVEVRIDVTAPQADRSALEGLLKGFQTPLQKGDFYTVDGLRVNLTFGENFHPFELRSQSSQEEFFVSKIREYSPDLILTHYTDFFSTIAALKTSPSQTWVDLTDDEFPRLKTLESYAGFAEAYSKLEHLMVASCYLRGRAREAFPKAKIHRLPNIIPSLADEVAIRSTDLNAGFWLHVNPTEVKGIQFTLELARRLPKENFLIVGNWGSEMPASLPPNVTTQSRVPDLRPVFQKAKGLLMPSMWQEAFGRLPLEAMHSSVPVVTSSRGGLPESVGSGGLCLPLEIDLWIAALQRPTAILKMQAEQGRKRAQAYREEVLRRYQALKKLWIQKSP